MSRRRNPTDELAEQLGCLIFVLLWAGIVGLFTLIFKASQTSPEDQLLKLQPGYGWLWQIEPVDCGQCEAVNESYRPACYICGAPLASPEPVAVAATGSTPNYGYIDRGQPGQPSSLALNTVIGFVVIISLVAALVAVAVLSGAS